MRLTYHCGLVQIKIKHLLARDMDSGEACVDKLAPPSECGEVRDPLAAPGGRGAANILCGPPAVGMRLWRGLGGRLEKEDP